jgi:hypothetical protein
MEPHGSRHGSPLLVVAAVSHWSIQARRLHFDGAKGFLSLGKLLLARRWSAHISSKYSKAPAATIASRETCVRQLQMCIRGGKTNGIGIMAHVVLARGFKDYL